MSQPYVSIIIPCRNEQTFIGKCLDTLLAQTYSKEALEIIVVDGMSADHTKEIVEQRLKTSPFPIHFIVNEKKITPIARNIGIQKARGDIVCFLDAHAEYTVDYIATCVQYLTTTDADSVGGSLRTLSRTARAQSRAIARVLSHPLGVGGSRFRRGVSAPQFVDAVFGGCFWKKTFSEIGMFNENLIRSQDMEFFIRMRRAGKKILLVPAIVATYYPKETIANFFMHNIKDGIWAIYPIKFTHTPLRLRHYIPLFFTIFLITLGCLSVFSSGAAIAFLGVILFYSSVVIAASFQLARKEKDVGIFIAFVFSFFARHFGYGVGSLIGALKLLIPQRLNRLRS